ncbi:MAG TPA: DUF167 domain-containing protein [Candidatus Dojkabacteria bacterium]|jgi:uncharacterized protein (TIGR00251 family)
MIIRVKVKPNAKLNSIKHSHDSRFDYIVTTKAPAEHGKANQEMTYLVARHLKLHQNQIRILAGGRNNIKVLKVNE